MDEIQIIQTMISSIGFPIVACIFLYKQNCNQAEQHKQEIDRLSAVIENNTLSITKMYEKMDALIDLLSKREMSRNED